MPRPASLHHAALASVVLSATALSTPAARAQATAPAPARDSVVVHVAGAAADSAFRAIAAGPPIFRDVPTGSATYRYLVSTRRETGDAELHERWDDVAVVRSGAAVLRTGPALADARQVEPREWKGSSIVSARDRRVAPGDLVVIPAGVAHQWRVVGKAPFSYVTLKVAAGGGSGGGSGGDAATRTGDTARYVILTSDRPAGFYREWWSNGELHSVFEFNDRGRGPHIEAVVTPGAGGAPAAMRAVGHAYLKDTVDERFSTSSVSAEGRSATWKSTLEQGAARVEPKAPAFYVNSSDTPTLLPMLVRAALSTPRVPLLPSGEASAALVQGSELTVQQPDGTPARVALYELNGLGFSPQPVWLEQSGRQRFALVSGGWTSLVPEGWEKAIPEMVRRQEAARDARLAALGRSLAHRPAGGVLVIRNARLFVAESATVRPHTTVVVRGNRVAAVGPDGSVPTPANATTVDAAGRTLLPGLWDMHVHINPGEEGLLHVAGGVTSARDMGNDTVSVLAMQRQFATDSLVGPRLVLAGLIDGPGPFQVPTAVLAADSAAAVRAVDWYAAHGYEQIKVYSSVKPELVPIIVAAAHRKGLRVSGHVPAYMKAEQVVKLGFDELQHANMLMLNFLDSVKDTRSMARFTEVGKHAAELDFASPRVREFVALLKAKGVDIDPTLATFEGMFNARPGQLDPSQEAIADRVPPMVRRGFYAGGLPVSDSATDRRYRDSYRAMMRMVKTLYDAGVPVVAGTDAEPVGFALHRELELYVRAGLPAPEVLKLATLGAARTMHHDRELGSVAAGKLADMVLVDGDPTASISDVRRTWLVVKNGIMYQPAELYGALGIKPVVAAAR